MNTYKYFTGAIAAIILTASAISFADGYVYDSPGGGGSLSGNLSGDIDLNGHKLCIDNDGGCTAWIEGYGANDSMSWSAFSARRFRVDASLLRLENVGLSLNSGRIITGVGIINLGDTAYSGHSIGADDVGVEQDIGVGGNAFFDGTVGFYNTNGNGGSATYTYNNETLTFAADPGDASKTTSGLIPDGAYLHAVTSRITTTGTNCTSIDIGDGTDVDLFADDSTLVANDTTSAADFTANISNPQWDGGADVTVTGVGGNCFDLVIRITAIYTVFSADTSN